MNKRAHQVFKLFSEILENDKELAFVSDGSEGFYFHFKDESKLTMGVLR